MRHPHLLAVITLGLFCAALLAQPTGAAKPDRDRDGMPNSWELRYGLNPKKKDSNGDRDRDGLRNRIEFRLATNPLAEDTDADGADDADEVRALATDPRDPDGDDDGTLDGDEDADENGIANEDEDDALEPCGFDDDDVDVDGIANEDENDFGTDPDDADSDDDGTADGDEDADQDGAADETEDDSAEDKCDEDEDEAVSPGSISRLDEEGSATWGAALLLALLGAAIAMVLASTVAFVRRGLRAR